MKSLTALQTIVIGAIILAALVCVTVLAVKGIVPQSTIAIIISAILGWVMPPPTIKPEPVAPPAPPAPAVALVLPLLALCLCLSGCGFSLTAARAPRADLAPLPAECDAIDREHSVATLGAGILGGLAGGSGLTAIPVQDPDVRGALVTGAAVSGVGAAGMSLWSQERAERYQRRCGR